MIKRAIIALIFINGFLGIGYTQPYIKWENNYGGSSEDWPQRLQYLSNGQFVVAGTSESDDVDVGQNNGNKDGWVVKSDFSGQVFWSKTFGGNSRDIFNDMEIDRDGGILLFGTTESDSKMFQNQSIYHLSF